MAAPTYVAHTTGANTLPFTLAAPAGVQAGDLELILVETANEAVSAPSGWLEVPSSPQGTGTAAGLDSTRLTIFYRVSTGLTDDATVPDAGNHQVGVRIAFRGVDTESPFVATTGEVIATATQSAVIPQVTSDVADTMYLFCMSCGVDASSLPLSSAWTNPGGTLSSFGELLTFANNLGNGGALAVAQGVGTGASGTANVTIGSSLLSSYVQGHITLALRPGAPSVTERNPWGKKPWARHSWNRARWKAAA